MYLVKNLMKQLKIVIGLQGLCFIPVEATRH